MNKVAFEFDPFELAGVEAPKDKKKKAQALEEIADYVNGEVLAHCGDGSTPIQGGQWKRSLSKEYREKKAEISGVTYANMELYGDMLNDLETVHTNGNKLSLQIVGENAPKADGHNNHSGKSPLPPREFIPKKGQTFNSKILRGIRAIAEEFSDGEGFD